MTKILVTGGAGFIGSHVVDLFIEQGFQVVIVDDLSTGRESNINPKAAFYKMDIRSPKLRSVFLKEKPDYVSHHAAQMDVRRSVKMPYFDAEVNILGSLNVIQNAVEFKVKHFLYASTGGAVYGEPEYHPCDEAHSIHPICPYGISKHTVEHYLYLYDRSDRLKYTVLRYPNVYGPRQNPKGEAGVVAIFIGRMLAGDAVIINGDGEQTRDFVHVTDCAMANYLAGSMMNSGVYNIGSGQPTSVKEIFHILAKIIGYPHRPVFGAAKDGETRHIYLNADKAKAEMEWEQTVPLNTGLEGTVEYFRKHEVERV